MTSLFLCLIIKKKTCCRSGATDVVSHGRMTTIEYSNYCVDKQIDLAKLLTLCIFAY